MSETVRPYEKLVEIKVFGKTFRCRSAIRLLRCFQFISPGDDSLTGASAGIRIASIAV